MPEGGEEKVLTQLKGFQWDGRTRRRERERGNNEWEGVRQTQRWGMKRWMVGVQQNRDVGNISWPTFAMSVPLGHFPGFSGRSLSRCIVPHSLWSGAISQSVEPDLSKGGWCCSSDCLEFKVTAWLQVSWQQIQTRHQDRFMSHPTLSRVWHITT